MTRVHSIRIPVHGFVEFNDWERDIINHPVFQRLRRIRQLAFSDHLYPGSAHTRFEHSLGVMYVATRLFDALVERFEVILEDRLGYSPRKSNSRTLVRLAALLHDIGHAPFSHVGEEIMPVRESGRRYSHEDYTVELIRHEMSDVLSNHPHNRNHYNITGGDIADFLAGRSSLGAERLFWRALVIGQWDADRMDYLLRDAHHCGVEYGRFDLERIIDTLALVANASEQLPTDLQISISEGGRHSAEGLLLARYFMFQQVYFHHVRKAYDHHALCCLAEYLKQRDGEGRLPSPATAAGRKKFLKLDDWLICKYIEDRADKCRHARAIKDHRHDRAVHSTGEVAKKQELELLDKLKAVLAESGIDSWVGDADKEWYKTRGEILIAPRTEGTLTVPVGTPLSELSSIAQRIPETKQRVLFVASDKRKQARQNMRRLQAGSMRWIG